MQVTHQAMEKLENNWKLGKLAEPHALLQFTHEDSPDPEAAGPGRAYRQGLKESQGSPPTASPPQQASRPPGGGLHKGELA